MTLKTSIRGAAGWIGKQASWPLGSPPTKIKQAVLEVELQAAGVAPRIPPTKDIADVKRRLLQASADQDLNTLSLRDWKRAPWAFWYNGDEVASNQPIVDEFFRRAEARKSASWLKALIGAYLINFPSQSNTLNPVAGRLRVLILSEKWRTLMPWIRRHEQFQIFSPTVGPQKVAEAILSATSLNQGLQIVGLDRTINQTAQDGFLAAAYKPAVDIVRTGLGNGQMDAENITRRLVEWSLPPDIHQTGLRYPSLSVPLVESLLLPWRSRNPDAGLERLIKQFLLDCIGDPRIRPGAWQMIDPNAKEVMLRWLAGETLEQFFEILSKTADDIWAYRKKFWTAYYHRGAIREAWFALGVDAWGLGKQIKQRIPGLDFGGLSGAQSNQSVLLMKLDRFVVAEWSHSGKCRFWLANDPAAPSLYKREYHGTNLRRVSLHDQTHYHSQNGTWQREIADFVRRETGIAVSQRDWT